MTASALTADFNLDGNPDPATADWRNVPGDTCTRSMND
jgi:hypothetical protein